jgi:hypothetical protein
LIIFLATLGPLNFHYKIYKQFVNAFKIPLNEIVLDIWVLLGRTDILAVLSLLVHENGIYLHLIRISLSHLGNVLFQGTNIVYILLD